MDIAERIKDILKRSPTTHIGLWTEFARRPTVTDPDTVLERLIESGEIIMGPDELLRLKDDPKIEEQKQDPDNDETVEMTLTVRLPRATADAIKNGLPYRVEPIPTTADPEITESKPDPEIANKPKRPGYVYQTWKQFCDAGMLWWVNRGLHLLGWVLVAMVEEDGTISGVYPARTRYRGFSEKDESEGFRKVTADIQAHMTELVEDCADET